jgi:Dimerisation domain
MEPALPSRTQLDDLRKLAGAFRISRAICVAAELGLADLLAYGPQTAAFLAEASHADTNALFRLLRLLTGVGLFEEATPGRFALTRLELGSAETCRGPSTLNCSICWTSRAGKRGVNSCTACARAVLGSTRPTVWVYSTTCASIPRAACASTRP